MMTPNTILKGTPLLDFQPNTATRFPTTHRCLISNRTLLLDFEPSCSSKPRYPIQNRILFGWAPLWFGRDIQHAYLSFNFLLGHSARSVTKRTFRVTFFKRFVTCLPFLQSFFVVTALNQRWSVTGHLLLHENIQYNLLFQRTYNMTTFLQIFLWETALGQRWSVRSTCDLASLRVAPWPPEKMNYHSAKSGQWFRGSKTDRRTNKQMDDFVHID